MKDVFYMEKYYYTIEERSIDDSHRKGCAPLKEYIVDENESGQRIDRFLLKLFKNTTRGNIYKLLRKKVIRLNGRKASPEQFVMEKDVLQVHLSDEQLKAFFKEEEMISATDAGLDIVYEDAEILVVNKPKGLLTHPDKSEYANTLSSKVIVYLRPYCTRTFKPAPVQRLDKNTSGLVLFGKTYEAMKKYNALMRQRAFRKYYLTIVEGKIDEPGEIVGYIEKDHDRNRVILAKEKLGMDSKPVHTKYRPLRIFKDYTLVEVELLTGRSHQIRVSLSAIGHPIVGDTKYGGAKRYGISNQLLHAYKMTVEGHTFQCENGELDAFVEKLTKKGKE